MRGCALTCIYSELEEVEDELDATLADKSKAEHDRDVARAEVEQLRAQLASSEKR